MTAADRAHNLLVDGIASLREVLGLPPTVSDLEICKAYGPLLAGWLTAAATIEAKREGGRHG
jgi:hypothetical protein